MAALERQLRARIATEHRRRDPDPDLITDLQRQRAVVRIEDSVRSILSAAPPLTAADRHRVVESVTVLLGGDADAA